MLGGDAIGNPGTCPCARSSNELASPGSDTAQILSNLQVHSRFVYIYVVIKKSMITASRTVYRIAGNLTGI